MNLNKKLMKIRVDLKLAKDEFNPEFGFQYRNAEAMLAQIKPALAKENLTLWFDDDVVAVGSHNYVKTILTVADAEDGEEKSVTAMAREDDVQTMPASPMVTGAASSYARKYALQGMFAIDDGRMDPDTLGTANDAAAARVPAPAPAQIPAPAPAPVQEPAPAPAPVPAKAATAPQAPAAPDYGNQPVAAPPAFGLETGEVPAPQVPAPVVDDAAPAQAPQDAPQAPYDAVPTPPPIQAQVPAPAPVQAPAQAQAPAPQADPWGGPAPDPVWEGYGPYDGYDVPAPDYGFDPYTNGPVTGSAPQMPDFGPDDAEPTQFPWQTAENDPYAAPAFEIPTVPGVPNVPDVPDLPGSTSAPGAPSAPAPTGGANAKPAKAKAKRKLVPLGVSFEHEFGRSKILTDAGIVYYKATDEGTIQGPWSADVAKLDDVDLDDLYEESKRHTGGVSLSDYVGMILA